jgi:hypothetical protein
LHKNFPDSRKELNFCSWRFHQEQNKKEAIASSALFRLFLYEDVLAGVTQFLGDLVCLVAVCPSTPAVPFTINHTENNILHINYLHLFCVFIISYGKALVKPFSYNF